MRKWWLIGIGVVLLAIAGGFFYITSIDWNEHKAKIAAEISQKTGKNVVIAGPLSLSIFPSPNFMVQDVKIFSQDKQISEPLASAAKIVARLDLLPFIKGEFKVTRMSVTNPVLRIEVFEDGTQNWKSDLTEAQKRELQDTPVTLESVTLENAEIDYVDKLREIDWRFTNLNAEVIAQTLFGPYKIDGSYIKNNMPEGFSIEMGRLSDDFNTTLNFVFNNPQLGTIYRFDGSVLFKNESVKGSFIFDTQKLVEYINANSKDFKLDKKYDFPLSLSTAVTLDKDKLEFSDLVVKYGKTAAAGNVIIPRLQEVTDWNQKDKEERRKVEMAFNMTDVDLDLAEEFLKDCGGKYFKGEKFELNPVWDVIADIKAVKGNYRQQNVKNVDLSFDIIPGKIEINRLNMVLPGETALESKGEFFPDEKKLLTYRFEVGTATENLDMILNWLGYKPEVRAASTYKKFSAQATVTGNNAQIKLSPFEASFDNTVFKGSLGGALKDDKKQIFAIVEADSISFDNYLAPLPAELSTASLDQKLKYLLDKLAAYKGYEIHFMSKAGLMIYGGVPFENVQFNGSLNGGILDVKNFSIGSLLNSKVNLTGKVSGFGGQNLDFDTVSYEFETQKLASPLNWLEISVPGLNPEVIKTFSSRGKIHGNQEDFSLQNTFKIGKTDGEFNGRVNRKDEQKLFSGEIKLKNPDFVQMLNDWGVNYKPNVYSLGVFSLDGSLEAGKKRLFISNGKAVIGQDVFSGSLTYDNTQGRPKVTGQLNVNQLEFERYFYGSNVKSAGEQLSFLKAGNAKAAFLPKPQPSTEKINYEFYNRFDLNMSLEIAKFIYRKTSFDNLKGTVIFDMGNLSFNDVQTVYKNAEIRGGIKLATATMPVMISANFDVQNLSMEDVGAVGQKYGFEGGLMSGQTVIEAPAESEASILSGLNGEASFSILDTKFRGWNIAPIIADLRQRKISDGLAGFVKQNLESGTTPLKKVDGTLIFKGGNFEAKDIYLAGTDFSMSLGTSGSLPEWESVSVFDIKVNNPGNLPVFGFRWSGTLSDPMLELNLSPLTDKYDAEQNKIAEARRAREQAIMDALKEKMQKQLDMLKLFEGNFYKINREYQQFLEQAQKAEIVDRYQKMGTEVEEIQKIMAEISTLALTPKYDDNVIKQAEDKLKTVIDKLSVFRTEILRLHIEDLKYQIGQNYDKAAEIKSQAQNNVQAFRDKDSDLEKRLKRITTVYELAGDQKVGELKKSVEELLVKIVEANEQISHDYLNMKSTDDADKLSGYLESGTQIVEKMESDLQKLSQDSEEYMKYTEEKVGGEEDRFNKAKREAEIKRKVAENIGKISVKEDGKKLTRTVVRDIEDIEKSEALQQKEAVKVLDFSDKKKPQNVVVREDREPEAEQKSQNSTQKQEGGFLRKTSGTITKASGIIRKK